MSDTQQTAPTILTAPQRGTRRLGALPTYGLLALGGALAVGAVVILHGARDGSNTSSSGDTKPVAASSGGALAGVPSHGEIPAKHPVAARSPAPAAAQGQPAAGPSAAPAPAATPLADDIYAQAMRQQWQQYYQQVAQLREQRRQAAVEAVRGDTSVSMDQQTGVRGPLAPGGDPEIAAARQEVRDAQAAAAAAGRGGGVGGQQAQRGPRPGSLYEGPSDPSRDYLNAGVTPPISRYEIKAGDPIVIRFTSGVSSEAPGQWTAIVAKPVFDHATGLHTLIPAGTRVVGNYDQMMTVGTERLPGGATRFIFPGEGGGSLDLGSMPIGDQAGYAGMRDKVDRHIGRLLLNTAMLGIAGGGAQLTQPRGGGYGRGIDASQILAAQLGLQFGQVGAEYARRELQTRPTHTVRPGWTGTIQVTQDIAFAGEWIDGVGFVP